MEGSTCVPPSAMRRCGDAGSWSRKRQIPWHNEKGKWKYRLLCKECPGSTQGSVNPSVALKLTVLGRRCGVMTLAALVY